MTTGELALANRRGALLLTALAMACLRWPGARPEIAGAIEAWLSGWRGLGLLVDGMGRRGYDLELVVFERQAVARDLLPDRTRPLAHVLDGHRLRRDAVARCPALGVGRSLQG